MARARRIVVWTLLPLVWFLANCTAGRFNKRTLQPRAASPSQVPSIVKAVPHYTSFGYSGLAFFRGKLYATSNIGLLEYEAGHLSTLYKWYDEDDFVSGPWLDASHSSPWMLHEAILVTLSPNRGKTPGFRFRKQRPDCICDRTEA
jgi:hypothetical protein